MTGKGLQQEFQDCFRQANPGGAFPASWSSLGPRGQAAWSLLAEKLTPRLEDHSRRAMRDRVKHPEEIAEIKTVRTAR